MAAYGAGGGSGLSPDVAVMSMIEVWSAGRTVKVQELARCTHRVGDIEYTYVLHADPGNVGYNLDLHISELGSGFETGAVPIHPQTKRRLTEEHTRPARRHSLRTVQLAMAMHSAVSRLLAGRSAEHYHEAVTTAIHRRLCWELENGT